MKMYCKIKRPDNTKYQIEKGTKVVIQEKIDGSNTAIYNDNGKIRLYSRSNELTGDNGFGFDEIFELENGKTLAELTNKEKNEISARKKAIEELKSKLGSVEKLD